MSDEFLQIVQDNWVSILFTLSLKGVDLRPFRLSRQAAVTPGMFGSLSFPIAASTRSVASSKAPSRRARRSLP
jgi:hypothetical protein